MKCERLEEELRQQSEDLPLKDHSLPNSNQCLIPEIDSRFQSERENTGLAQEEAEKCLEDKENGEGCNMLLARESWRNVEGAKSVFNTDLKKYNMMTVSYTHLTLPTICSV
eukprot:TRINITY_DN15621_c0_g1_i1.p2 TRINITY_DN15621_c0_g1~~TRINITY_DN15621_c0_g1_i1.p2  ORF type:complete len:111 (+),score=44.64 TRINITY_DN15621_c0_g1_i1:603-935(+)